MRGPGHNLSNAFSTQRGLSLVELLIATALGVLILLALTQLFADVSRTNREMAKTNSQIESARFAMQFLRTDIVHAGYWSSFVPLFDDLMLGAAPPDTPQPDPGGAPGAPYSPCLPFSTPWTPAYLNSLIGLPVMVYGTPPANCAAVVADQVPNTHVLVVRHAETCVAGEANCDAVVAGRLYFQASNCSSEIAANNLYALGPTGLVLTERDCTTAADVRRVIQNIYYVRSWANVAGDGIPTLVRSEFDLSGATLAQQPPVALVQGIERFRVEVGLDQVNDQGNPVTSATTGPSPNYPATSDALAAYSNPVDWLDPDDRRSALNRGDGVPETPFLACPAAGCTAAQLVNVVAVKVFLLARASEETPGYLDTKTYTLGGLAVPAFNDSFKRHVFSGTVRVNNVAARRETPL